MSSCSRNEAFTGTLRRKTQATTVSTSRNGTYQNAAFCNQTVLVFPALLNVCDPPNAPPATAKEMIHGVTNWVRLTPKFPMPAWMPSAVPCRRFGKNTLVLGMNEEKSPPPNPTRKASSRKTQNGVAGFITAKPSPRQGRILAKVASAITLRVPKIGIRNMWISRSEPPARPGIAVSQNNCISVNLNPMPGKRTTTALMTNQVANDRTSEMVVIHSVRQAILLPVDSQNAGPPASSRANNRRMVW